MKNQYFGDVNDYRKYGLLRTLAGRGEISMGICWMLTPSDGRTDGAFVEYLDQPARWRAYDPDLYEFIAGCVCERGERNVSLMEGSDLLPGALFHTALLRDTASERRGYFRDVLERFQEVELIFFDPDNGFEVRSKPYGRRDSSKCLYWREALDAFASGHSVLVYQHFTREPRDAFVQRLAGKLRLETGAQTIRSFRTPHVVFFLAPRPEHEELLECTVSRVAEVWQGQIRAMRHD